MDEKYASAVYTYPFIWSNFNEENQAGIFSEKNGLKHKHKFIANTSFNIWIGDQKDTNIARHIHAYEYRNKRKDVF